ncbi:uncharacterized protein HaLaN_25263, partial [Haematococcus lacustris]
MLSFWVTGFMGVAGICISLAWLVHIAVYLLPSYPLHPMLNDLFVVLDGAFSLLGVAAFSAFCLYLMVVAMKGNFIMGLDFVFIKLYPMRPGKTLMSAFLVNTGIILTMAPAIIQFCSSAFAVYGSNTDIFDVFGNQVMYLQGISWIYQFNIFLYAFYAVVFISLVMTVFKGRKKWERQRDKFHSWLKPGGRLLLTDYCLPPGGAPDLDSDTTSYLAARRYHLVSLEAYEEVAVAAGFTEVVMRDQTDQFVVQLQRELAGLRAQRPAFTAAYGVEVFDACQASWEGKLRRAQAGQQRWVLLTALK